MVIRLPDSTDVGPTPSGNSGRPIATIDFTPIGRGLQQFGGGLQDAGGNVMQAAKVANLEQKRDELFQTSTNFDAQKAETKNLYEDFKANAPADPKNFANNWLSVLTKRQQDFLPSIPASMRPRIQAMQALERQQWGGVASTDQRAMGVKYSSGILQSDYENYRKEINLDPNSRDAAEQALNAKIDMAPYLDAATREDMKQKARNGIEVAQWKALYGTDPAGGAKAFGRGGQGGAAGAPDNIFHTMVTRVENQAGDAGAVSPKGAIGLAQVMPDTARDMARKLGMDNVAYMSDDQLQQYFKSNPDVNLKIGRAYFDEQVTRYGGDQQAAVVAYNAGPKVADKYVASGKDTSVLPSETQAYLTKVFGPSAQTQPEEESPDNFPDASSTVPHNTTPDTIGLTKYLVAGKGSESVTGMQMPLQQGLSAMFAAAPPDVQPYLKIFSGYRSNERQAQLYAAALQKYGSPEAARKWVAPPGHSEHNKGMAADLAFDGAGTTAKLSANGQRAMQWAHDNASKFGLAFPLSNEPWHVEPTGARGGGGSSQIVGGVPDPRFSSITLDQQEGLLRQAEASAAINRGQITAQIKDDLASMQQTGQGLSSLTADQVRVTLGDDAANSWLRQRQLAQNFHDATADFASLPDELIQKRVASLSPAPGREGFIDAQQYQNQAQKYAQDIIQQRQTDPAEAVSNDPAVQQAASTASLRNPSSYQALVKARLAAQTALGIPPTMQSPMTWAESQQFLAPLLKALPNQQKEALTQVVQQVSSVYGDQADAALGYMMGQYKADAAQKAIVGSILRKIGLGQPITRDDARQFDDANKDAAANAAVTGILGPNQGSFPVPPVKAIDRLRQNPGLAPKFDELFGPGRAAQILQFNAQPQASKPAAVPAKPTPPDPNVRPQSEWQPTANFDGMEFKGAEPPAARGGPSVEPQNDVLPGTPPSVNGGDGLGGTGVGM